MKKLLYLLAVTSIVLASCKKEGCTDPEAVNFCEDCKKDDNTCTFEGSTVLWYGKTVSDSTQASGITSFSYTIDSKVAGSSASNVYYTVKPTCGENGSITYTKDLGKDKSKTVAYEVKDNTGLVLWSGNVDLKANTCVETELTW